MTDTPRNDFEALVVAAMTHRKLGVKGKPLQLGNVEFWIDRSTGKLCHSIPGPQWKGVPEDLGRILAEYLAFAELDVDSAVVQ